MMKIESTYIPTTWRGSPLPFFYLYQILKLANMVIDSEKGIHFSDEKRNIRDLVPSPSHPVLRGAHGSESSKAQVAEDGITSSSHVRI